MSGLTKKTVYADRLLSTMLGVNEGELVSYAEISKGVHRYIRNNNLTRTPAKAQPATQPTPQPDLREATSEPSTGVRHCNDCGAEIPSDAVFCDMCGVAQ